jgi:hypothetical protein
MACTAPASPPTPQKQQQHLVVNLTRPRKRTKHEVEQQLGAQKV